MFEYSYGQDPQFSQFYAAPLYLGPSFAGTSEATRVVINYRDQWPRLPGSFVTTAFSIDHNLTKYKSGIGFLLLRDNAGKGMMVTSNVGAMYSYDIKINKDIHVRPGIHALYYHSSIDFHSQIFADQIKDNRTVPVSVETVPVRKEGHFDFSSSALLFSKEYWLGFTIDHLMSLHNTYAENVNNAPLKFSLYGGGKININKSGLRRNIDAENILLAFHLKSQNKNIQLDFGMYYNKTPYLFGIWYRGIPIFKETISQDAITILFGYKFQDFNIGYNYDFTISRLITTTGGAHEISLIYIFDHILQTNRRKIYFPTPCPTF